MSPVARDFRVYFALGETATTAVSRKAMQDHRRNERPQSIESVSSLMREAAVELFDAAIVSSPPYC